MHIRKIKLSDYGIKGMEVEYIKPEEKNGVRFENEYKVKYHHPVPLVLRNKISSLKEHLIAVNGLSKKSDLTITYVMMDGTGFKFGAKMRVLERYFVNVEIPYFTEQCDEIDFDGICKEISEVFKGAKEYVEAGPSAIDNKQLLLDFMDSKKDKGQAIELDVQSMTPEQMKEEALKILENMGAIIMMPEDLETGAEVVVDNEANFQEMIASGEKEASVIKMVPNSESVNLSEGVGGW